MSNHIHLIWQALNEFTPSQVQSSFMKYTSHQMMQGDRDHQLWKREPLGDELFTPDVFHQKLDYIHNNPVRAGLGSYREEYYYSSAKFYQDGIDNFGMVTHYSGN